MIFRTEQNLMQLSKGPGGTEVPPIISETALTTDDTVGDGFPCAC